MTHAVVLDYWLMWHFKETLSIQTAFPFEFCTHILTFLILEI